jgi:hypothetical protein
MSWTMIPPAIAIVSCAGQGEPTRDFDASVIDAFVDAEDDTWALERAATERPPPDPTPDDGCMLPECHGTAVQDPGKRGRTPAKR